MNRIEKIITNQWVDCNSGTNVASSSVLSRNHSVEGIEVNRYFCTDGGKLALAGTDGHIFSLLSGSANLRTACHPDGLTIGGGAHVYVPPAANAKLTFTSEATAIHAATGASNSKGQDLLIHDERFFAPARFVLTPQYLSRRAFLHRDATLLSKSGNPIAWFNTTMFDTRGLPRNNEDTEVFKMSYDYQSEINVVYEVQGNARVRFAIHPYVSSTDQDWTTWSQLDNETTYYLNESKDDSCVEHHYDANGKILRSMRNRHEIFIEPNGYVSLCCLFDPAPTGLETHQPGEYSSYGPVTETLASEDYLNFLETASESDEMIRVLSLRAAEDPTMTLNNVPQWAKYESELSAAMRAQSEQIFNSDPKRKNILRAWSLTSDRKVSADG